MGRSGIITGVFLQVRLDSTRLPEKALLMLEDKTVFEHVLSALSEVNAGIYAVLTDSQSRPMLKPIAERYGWKCFAGSRQNVLERFVKAAYKYGVNRIVRATGDNPLVSSYLANMLLSIHQESLADYSGFVGMPLGMGVEIVETAALEEAYAQSGCGYEREHVTPYIYNNADKYKIVKPKAPPHYQLSEARVTLDTEDDYSNLQRIYRAVYNGKPIEDTALMTYLKRETQKKAVDATCQNRTSY